MFAYASCAVASKYHFTSINQFKYIVMLQIINYSEKAVAVIGDTKEIKEQLKSMGGRFNPRLSCGAGWIFSAKKRDELESIIGTGKAALNVAKYAPRVYCGTYGKYSSGSIEGGWITITDYSNGKEVLKACADLHKDEPDPEFMFQDFENFPEQFYGECMGEKDFDEIIAWWNEEQAKPQEKPDELIEEYVAEMGGDDYYRKNTAKVIRLSNGGLYVFDKHIIKTRFCFHDEGAQYEFYCKLCKDEAKLKRYFFNKNLNGYDEAIKRLTNKDLHEYDMAHDWRFYPEYEGKNVFEYADFNTNDFWLNRIRDKSVAMTEEDRIAIIKATKELKSKMEKRLEAWWKRYGAKKIYMWTYWADA